MTPTRPVTMTDDDTTTTRQDSAAGNRVRQALAEARRARHHDDCHCRMYRGTACNATDALFQRAINRELDHMNKENAK